MENTIDYSVGYNNVTVGICTQEDLERLQRRKNGNLMILKSLIYVIPEYLKYIGLI